MYIGPLCSDWSKIISKGADKPWAATLHMLVSMPKGKDRSVL